MTESGKKWWFWGQAWGKLQQREEIPVLQLDMLVRTSGGSSSSRVLNLPFSSSCQRGKSNSETAGNCSPRLCQRLAQESGKTPCWKEHSVYTEPSLYVGGNPKCKPLSQNAEEPPLFFTSLLVKKRGFTTPELLLSPYPRNEAFFSFLSCSLRP